MTATTVGLKRKAEVMEDSKTKRRESPYIPVFEDFRSELDQHHDRRERIIKASRDITAQSKKIIFALQRVRDLGKPIHQSISKQTMPMYATIRTLMEGAVPDLQGLNADRYHYNISMGIQEYMEAVLFQHYLESQMLLTQQEAAASLPPGIRLTFEDYLLGVFDMTGELMRFAITYAATNGKLPGSDSSDPTRSSILTDMQLLRSQLEGLRVTGHKLSREYEQKMKVTQQSVEKIENSVYSLLVRGKERPKGWRPDTSLVNNHPESEEIESY